MGRLVDQELRTLVEELGLTQDEARKILGLQSGYDPLLEDSVSPESDEYKLLRIKEMFPEISSDVVESTWKWVDGDEVACSDILLNHNALQSEDESTQPGSKLGRKQARIQRKRIRQDAKLAEAEEADVQFLANTLHYTKEQARELYWLHDSDVTRAVMSKMPRHLIPAAHVTSQDPSNKSMANPVLSEPLRSPRISPSDIRDQINRTELRIQTLRSETKPTGSSSVDRLRASDKAAELRDQIEELRQMQSSLLELDLYCVGQKGSPAHTSATKSMIDLHGCTLEQAQALTRGVIRKFKENRMSEVEIITGAGRHSARGKAVIKPWVKDFLKSQNLRMREEEGSFIVSQSI